jgi:hypothetical protein
VRQRRGHRGKKNFELRRYAVSLVGEAATLARDYAHVIADMRGQPTMSVNDAIVAARAARERRAG